MLFSRRELRTQDNTVSLYRLATAKLRVLPQVVIAGCQRSGTTSMYHYLIEHP